MIFISESQKPLTQKKWDENSFSIELFWQKESKDFLKELTSLRDMFLLKELKETANYFSKQSNKVLEKDILENFGIGCIIPTKYKTIKNNNSLFLATYNPPESDEIKNILIFSFSSKNKNTQQEVLLKTDSVFSKYFVGEEPGSRVRIEPNHNPYAFNNTYRGLWRLENGFMGGVFVIKTYHKKGKIIVSSGMVFAPNSPKRKHIKEFEAIL